MLIRTLFGLFMHVQVAAGQVLLERLTGPPLPPACVSTALALVGLDVGPSALLLHDGRHAEVHALRADGAAELAGSFECPGSTSSGDDSIGGWPCAAATSMVLCGQGVARTAGNRVEVCSYSGGWHRAVVTAAR